METGRMLALQELTRRVERALGVNALPSLGAYARGCDIRWSAALASRSNTAAQTEALQPELRWRPLIDH